MQDELLTARDVGKILGVTDRTVLSYARAGRLDYIKLSDATFRFERPAVDKLIEETRQQAMERSTSRGTGKKFLQLPSERAPQIEESE